MLGLLGGVGDDEADDLAREVDLGRGERGVGLRHVAAVDHGLAAFNLFADVLVRQDVADAADLAARVSSTSVILPRAMGERTRTAWARLGRCWSAP